MRFYNLLHLQLHPQFNLQGDNAFEGCNNASFTSGEIPTVLQAQGTQAFKDCLNLATMTA